MLLKLLIIFIAILMNSASLRADSKSIDVNNHQNKSHVTWNKGQIKNIPLNSVQPFAEQYIAASNNYLNQLVTNHGATRTYIEPPKATTLHNTGSGGIIAQYQQTIDGGAIVRHCIKTSFLSGARLCSRQAVVLCQRRHSRMPPVFSDPPQHCPTRRAVEQQ